MKPARILIEVVAGVMPNSPIPEYTKQFAITSDIWYADGEYEGMRKEADAEIYRIHNAAIEYMQGMMSPKLVNWVRLDWIYL